MSTFSDNIKFNDELIELFNYLENDFMKKVEMYHNLINEKKLANLC